jgi:lipoprotein-anchoring transpeptidase ErfK/SrfK
MTILTAVALVALLAQGAGSEAPRARQTGDRQPSGRSAVDLDALQLQVSLDRAGFSVGPIDAHAGANTKKALAAHQAQKGGPPPADVPAAIAYTITEADGDGPFVAAIPSDLVAQARLPSLAYTSMLEAIAERFHSTPALLQRLNPDARFAPGEQIQVPNVEPFVAPVEKPEMSPEARAAEKQTRAAERKQAAARPEGTSGRNGSKRSNGAQPNTVLQRPDVVVTVSKASSALTVQDASGSVLFYAPVTTGSERDPLPIGEWKVTGMQFNPKFQYNPKLFWDADPAHSKATIPSGPNNPVGLVWIDLNREHYGIHGTPEPSAIGRTESHGCVRLTNWDALKLAGMVKPGTRVIFTD